MRSKIIAAALIAVAMVFTVIIVNKSLLHNSREAAETVQAGKETRTEEGSQSPGLTASPIPKKDKTASNSTANPGFTPGIPDKETGESKKETGKAEQVKEGTLPGQASSQATPGQLPKATGTPAPIAIPDAVDQKASSIAKRDIEAQDYFKAAGVILGKLSLNEIKFLFDTASDEFWVTTPVEEIEKVRSIIFSKLTSADIATLRELGKKYGRSMTILEPDINVAETKEKQMAKKRVSK